MRTTMDDEVSKYGCDRDLYFGDFFAKTIKSKTRDKISNNAGLIFYHASITTILFVDIHSKNIEVKLISLMALHNVAICLLSG
jgi:hypothetical protein